MKNRIAVAISIMMLIMIFTGCTSGSYVTIGSNENNTATSMAMSYEKFNGHKSKTIHLNDGEIYEISADIVTTSGKLALSIKDKEDNSYYQGTDIPTSNFTVKLDKAGDYIITVEAKEHKGSYTISWKTTK